RCVAVFVAASSMHISILRILKNIFIFFFSSRRRHTRLVSDWSSDVCSSDLWRCCDESCVGTPSAMTSSSRRSSPAWPARSRPSKIGRASCRERGEKSGGGEAVKKKKIKEESVVGGRTVGGVRE